MKLAPWVALASVLLLAAGTLVDRRYGERESTTERFDFTGIDTIDVRAASVELYLRDGPALATIEDSYDKPLKTHREGATFVVEEGRADLYVPLHVRRISGASEIKVLPGFRVPVLEVEVEGWLSWTGDAGQLRVLDVRKGETCHDCGARLNVQKGRIDHLFVSTRTGTVHLADAPSLGEVVLELGEDADYELGGLHGPPPPVTLRPYPVPPAAPATTTKPAPTDAPSEPPRVQ